MTIAPLGREATLEDLFAVEGKAELVDGQLVLLPMTGDAHGTAVVNIVTSLKLHQRARGGGVRSPTTWDSSRPGTALLPRMSPGTRALVPGAS
jgi:hypothetical protein